MDWAVSTIFKGATIMGGALITFAYSGSGLQGGDYYFISFNTLLSMEF